MNVKSILFDLDGTLCDCTEVHYISLNRALKEVSGTVINREEHQGIFNGLPTHKKLDVLVSSGRVEESDRKKIWQLKQEFTKEAITELLHFDPVKVELLRYLKSLGIKVACVTNSIKETATLMLQRTGQFEYIDLLIANDMIQRPKPHAEGYIRGMILFNSLPEETITVEDSPVGLEAAYASSALVWKVSGYQDVNLQNYLNYYMETFG